MDLSPPERREIASLIGCNEQFLYQCLTGRNSMEAKDAVRAERESGGRIRRWDVRTRDWWQYWPELIGTEGAPAVPAATEEVRDAA